MEYGIDYIKLGFFKKILYRLSVFYNKNYAGFFSPISALKKSGALNKAAVICSYPVMGLGHILQKRIEKGILYMCFAALYLWFLFTAGIGAFKGTGIFTELRSAGIFVTIILSALFLYLYPKSVSRTVAFAKNPAREKSAVLIFLKRVSVFFRSSNTNLVNAYQGAAKPHKAALIAGFTIPGLSGFILKQPIKAALKVIVTAAFILYMAARGAADIVGLITLHTEGVKSNYNIVFGLLALFAVIAFIALYLSNISYTVRAVSMLRRGEKIKPFITEFKALFNKKLYILLLALPVAGVLIFTILPLIYMISIAFTDFATSESLGIIPNTVRGVYLSWTGFATFIKLFTISGYFKAFANVLGWTLIWAALATFSCYFGGLFLAMLINKKVVKSKVIFRSLFVLSMAIPQIVTLRVMYAMFHEFGPVNSLLMNWGIAAERISFWGNTLSAKTLIIFVNMWVGIPYFMLLMSGLLINIPQDLYEYAKVEGAGKMYAFRKITMPYILFMTMPLLITNFVSNINNFNVIWLLTGGGPGGQGTGGVAGGTDILITWLYKLTMQHNPDYNIGSAIGIIMFIISAGLSLIIYRNSSSYKREGDFA